MKSKSVVITAIIAISIMQIVAMFFNINGTFRAYCLAAIAGLAGWTVPTKYLNRVTAYISNGRK